MRHRTVTALASYNQPELVGAGEYCRPVHTDDPGRYLVPQVRADHPVCRIPVEQAITDHCQRTLDHLFGGLKSEHHGACETVFQVREDFGSGQCHRNVSVVTACVHPAVCGRKFQPGQFIDRKPVDIGPYHQGRAVPGTL